MKTVMSLKRNEFDFGQNSFLCSEQEIAALFSVTPPRIGQLSKEGMPREIGGYPLKECVFWYVKYLHNLLDENQNETVVAEKIRFMKAKTKKAEIEAKQLEGSMIEQGKMEQELQKILLSIKEDFFAVPGQCAPFLDGRPAAYIKIYLEKKMAEIFNTLGEKLSQ